MPWNVIDWPAFIPFALVTGVHPHWNVARFLEALIIAGGSALASHEIMSYRLDAVEQDMERNRRLYMDIMARAQEERAREMSELKADLRLMQTELLAAARQSGRSM